MAGTQAPGRLEEVRALVNTVECEDTTDPLTTDGSLAGWLASRGAEAPSADELRELRAFREAVRALLYAHAGEGSPAEAWEGLRPFARRVRFSLDVDAGGRPVLRGEGAGALSAVAEILAIVYDAVGAGTWQRLKACRKHSCRWAFYDRSKNGSGAWCNMAVCGNRVKAQRRRARQKSSENR